MPSSPFEGGLQGKVKDDQKPLNMLSYLIDLRDFSYAILKKYNGEAHAENGYKFQLMAYCCVCYMIVAEVVIMSNNKIRGYFSPIMYDRNFFTSLLFGTLMFVPYILFFQFLFRKMAKFPTDKDMPLKKYKSLRKKATPFFLLSIVLFVGVSYVINNFIA